MLYRKALVSVDILYYRPDYPSLVQEFLLQLDDIVPELVRVNRFLRFWDDNIDAVIKEVLICQGTSQSWRKVDWTNGISYT